VRASVAATAAGACHRGARREGFTAAQHRRAMLDGMPRLGLVVVVIVVVAVIAVIASTGGDDRPSASTPTPGATPSPTPTPQASIEPAGISEHLRALRDAAGSERTRAAGSAGDAATARYIAGRLRTAGYRVSEQAFRVPLFRERTPPRIAGLRRGRDFLTLTFSGSGRVSGRVRRVGLGCSPSPDVRRGEVAVADRGVCTFTRKARLAQRAGAAALLVISDRGAPFTGSLIGTGIRIPVLAVSTAAGRELGGRVRLSVDAESGRRTTHNVVGEIGPRDADRVVMAGAHLDSVVAGPGLNDDGSGVAAVLEVAEQLAPRPPEGAAVRVGFWAAEEIGLVGSRRYVSRLTSPGRRRIAAYVNLDMVGSPKGELAVYEGEGKGRAIEATLRDGLPDGAPGEELGGASDHASFARAGIPVGGLFTGLDKCYHRACDTIANVDAALAARAARVTAGALSSLAAAG
jgi:hypothetical protein